MKGAASATNDASPTPTIARQMSISVKLGEAAHPRQASVQMPMPRANSLCVEGGYGGQEKSDGEVKMEGGGEAEQRRQASVRIQAYV